MSCASTPPARGLYIAVAGPIGVGKSLFSQYLADEVGATLVPEVFTENPFLERLYQPGGIERWGLACEMSFLPHRHQQARTIEETLARGESVVTDWFLGQNLIYSRLTLSDEEFAVYQGVFDRLMQHAPLPDKLICLDADMPAILARVRGRGREMESTIDPDYLRRLREAYLSWREHPPVPGTPLYIDTTHLEIPRCALARAEAFHQVWDSLGWCPAQLQVPHRSRPANPVSAARPAVGGRSVARR
jgi:deoxyguanosine kinase